MGEWLFPTSIRPLCPQESRHPHPLGLCLQRAGTSNEFLARHTSYETRRVSSFIGNLCVVLWALTATGNVPPSRAETGQEKGTTLPEHPQSEAVQKAQRQIWEPTLYPHSLMPPTKRFTHLACGYRQTKGKETLGI